MRRYAFPFLAGLAILVTVSSLHPSFAAKFKVPPTLNFVLNNIDGKPVKLSKFQGKVILIVNVASKCGNTPQYTSLQRLYGQYKKQGFEILAFPANEFGQQEPGTNSEIKTFCNTNYHVTFPVFSKIIVKGSGIHPLYEYLTNKQTNPEFGGDIEWNFAKFLLNRDGKVIARFAAKLDPATPEVVDVIKRELAKKRQQ